MTIPVALLAICIHIFCFTFIVFKGHLVAVGAAIYGKRQNLSERKLERDQASDNSSKRVRANFFNRLSMTFSQCNLASESERHFLTISVFAALTFFSERELKFMFAICRRPSVRLSVVCRLSSVCNVRAPYSGD